MNISHKDLKQLFESYSESRIGNSRECCLSIEDLIISTRRKFSSRKRRQVSEHISNCPFCAKDMKWILEIQLESETLGHAVNTLARKSRKKVFGYGIPPSHAVASFLGFVALSICLWTLFGGGLFNYLSKARYGNQIQIWQIFEPMGKIERLSTLRFRWEYFGQADYFSLELFDETLALFWKSPNLATKTIQLPQEIPLKFYTGRPYFWMVWAYDRYGQSIESDLIQFIIDQDY